MIGDFKIYKKECFIFIRCVKLFILLFEEVRDLKLIIFEEDLVCFNVLEVVFNNVKILLFLCNIGSKFYLVGFFFYRLILYGWKWKLWGNLIFVVFIWFCLCKVVGCYMFRYFLLVILFFYFVLFVVICCFLKKMCVGLCVLVILY